MEKGIKTISIEANVRVLFHMFMIANFFEVFNKHSFSHKNIPLINNCCYSRKSLNYFSCQKFIYLDLVVVCT